MSGSVSGSVGVSNRAQNVLNIELRHSRNNGFLTVTEFGKLGNFRKKEGICGHTCLKHSEFLLLAGLMKEN